MTLKERIGLQKRIASLAKTFASNSMDRVARYRAQLRSGIRDRRKGLSGASTYWDGASWRRAPRKARTGHWESRSRNRAYAEKISERERERREANWRKSKVGRAVLRRRREGRYPTVKSGEAIREEIEEKRHLTTLRRAYRRGTLEEYLCPYHDLGMEICGDACSCEED